MSETKQTTAQELNEVQAIKQAKDFWGKFSKPITYIGGAIILVAGGWLAYKYFVIAPKDKKANEAIAMAQTYFAKDSLDLALNGDGANAGFLKIMKNYSGTDAGNLAHFYAGAIYLRKDDFKNAIKHLKDFSTGASQVQSAAWRMLGDALMSDGKKEDGAAYYEKAGNLNDKDEVSSSENLLRAAQAYENIGKTDKATSLYKAIKEKYPQFASQNQVDKSLARMGVIIND
jgi:tetratricopeptide (TPR) repeat protein